jgi:YggT family protein
MFVAGNFVSALAWLVEKLLWLYFWIIIARVLVSWVNADRYHPIVVFLYRVTEPVLRPVRRRLPDTMGLDLSPMVVIFVIYFLQIFLVSSLHDLAMSLR